MSTPSSQSQRQQTIFLHNEDATKAFAEQLAKANISGSVWLVGDLGAGKTTLTRYWLRALGHKGSVKSPTYTLVEPYSIAHTDGQPPKPVYHADLYRLQDPEELEFIGFDEYLDEPNSMVIIEWASRAEDYLPSPVMTIHLSGSELSNTEQSAENTNASASCRQVIIEYHEAIDLDLSSFSD